MYGGLGDFSGANLIPAGPNSKFTDNTLFFVLLLL